MIIHVAVYLHVKFEHRVCVIVLTSADHMFGCVLSLLGFSIADMVYMPNRALYAQTKNQPTDKTPGLTYNTISHLFSTKCIWKGRVDDMAGLL